MTIKIAQPAIFAPLEPVKVIIFDFDGTIADSFSAVLDITNRLAIEFGFEPVNFEEVRRLQNLNSREIIRQSKISIFKLPFLLRRVKAELNREIDQLKPIPGIQDALLALKQGGDRLGIVTSNSPENVAAFLETEGLAELFDFTYSGTTLFGKSKVLKRILKQNHFDPQTTIYVGDETRDIEAAKKTRIKGIAVSWGFNSRQALARQNPDFLIHQPSELVEAVRSLKSR